jgi:hypothetical protein
MHLLKTPSVKMLIEAAAQHLRQLVGLKYYTPTGACQLADD